MLPPSPAFPAPPPRTYTTLVTREAFDEWLARARAAELIAFKATMSSYDYGRTRTSSASRSRSCRASPRTSRSATTTQGVPDQLKRDDVIAALKPLLESEQPVKVGHDANTTRMHCDASASSCAACTSIRCSNRSCGTALRRVTISTRLRASISASRRSRSNRSSDAARSRFLQPGRARPGDDVRVRGSRCRPAAASRAVGESLGIRRPEIAVRIDRAAALARVGANGASRRADRRPAAESARQ